MQTYSPVILHDAALNPAANLMDTAPAKESLYDLYNDIFEMVVADTEELIDECYRLRYQVYCVEHPFEEPDPRLGEYERDDFDGHSIHALLRYRKTGEFIGTVRLIMDMKDSPRRMPILQACEDNNISVPHHIDTEPCAEISRFCIAKSFRRRITDSVYGTVYTPEELTLLRGRVIPYMALGLLTMVLHICREHEIRQCCAMMEPSLIRMLAKLGLHFTTIGQPIEHHGTRQPSFITLGNGELKRTLERERPDILEIVTDRGRLSLDY